MKKITFLCSSLSLITVLLPLKGSDPLEDSLQSFSWSEENSRAESPLQDDYKKPDDKAELENTLMIKHNSSPCESQNTEPTRLFFGSISCSKKDLAKIKLGTTAFLQGAVLHGGCTTLFTKVLQATDHPLLTSKLGWLFLLGTIYATARCIQEIKTLEKDAPIGAFTLKSKIAGATMGMLGWSLLLSENSPEISDLFLLPPVVALSAAAVTLAEKSDLSIKLSMRNA